MANRYLITRLLKFDILKTHEFRRPCGHDQLAFNSVDFAFVSRTLNERIKLPLADHLVNFKPTHVAHIHSYLHLWFDVG